MSDYRLSKEAVLQALSTVEEPDLKRDIVSLNMVKDIVLGIGSVRFTVVLTTPACPLKEVIRKRCEDAIHAHIGADILITIDMTSDVVLVVGDHIGIPDDIRATLDAVGAISVSLGPVSVHADDAVAIAMNELDRRAILTSPRGDGP